MDDVFNGFRTWEWKFVSITSLYAWLVDVNEFSIVTRITSNFNETEKSISLSTYMRWTLHTKWDVLDRDLSYKFFVSFFVT